MRILGIQREKYLLSLFEVFFESRAEFLGIFYKLLFPLLHRLLPGRTRNEAHNLVDSVQQFLDGTGNLSGIFF